MDEKKLAYDRWMNELDTVTHRKTGLRVRDLPDQGFQAAYDVGVSPADTFKSRVRPQLEDLGFHLAIAELFDEAQSLGTDHFSPRCVAEAGLEYMTGEEFYLTFVDEPTLDESVDEPF